MSNARNLANLLGTDTKIKTADIADEVFNSNRNLIINGAMAISQRGTDINTLTNGSIGADRFKTVIANVDDLAMDYDQSTDVPSGSGFANSLKLSVASPEGAIAADEYVSFGQRIEAQNLQHLKYGTSSGEKITLSFHVKSSVTGTYAISIFQQDASSSPDRRYHSKSYTISSANTWEYKTITIDPNTNDAIANDTGIGLRVDWVLSAGSNYTSGSNDTWGDITNWMVGHNASWITTSGATFFLTGVQLEVGEQATPFEHRSFADELASCQRYHYRIEADAANDGLIGALANFNGTSSYGVLSFPVEMRTAPSAVTSADNTFTFYSKGQTRTPTNVTLAARATKATSEMHIDWSSSLNDGGAGWLRAASDSALIGFDAEL